MGRNLSGNVGLHATKFGVGVAGGAIGTVAGAANEGFQALVVDPLGNLVSPPPAQDDQVQQ